MSDHVLGPYRLVKELGSGGMAAVYLAILLREHCGLPAGERVAVKVLHSHLLGERSVIERFRLEADAGRRIDHPNVVRMLDIHTPDPDEGGRPYLVMEYVEGQSLRDLLNELGRVPEDLSLTIAREVAAGLAAIHAEGIVHRDLKPENILITRDNCVKVMDLGVAYLVDQRIRISVTGQFVGSVYYAAPEQIMGGGKHLDARVDLYQLGLVLYELLTGHHPYRSKNLSEALAKVITAEPERISIRNPQVSPFFEELVHRLLAKSPEERFQTSAHLYETLLAGERSSWWREQAIDIRNRTKRPIRRVRNPHETALYGREEEISTLDILWEKARAGQGRAVLLLGDGGSGKTRIIDEFETRVSAGGAECHLLYGAYLRGQTATGNGAFSRAYREYFGAEQIEAALAVHLGRTPLLIPAFAALLRGEDPPEGEEPLTRDSIQSAFIDVTRSLAEDRPTVLLIEDLHLAHKESLDLFAKLAGALADRPLLLVGSARPELPATWGHVTRTLRRIEIARLPRKAIQGLLREALGSSRLAEALLDRIYTKSGGKPFYVFEILRGLREGQFIGQRQDGTWVTTREIREIRVPSTIRDLVVSRLRDLSLVDRRVIEMAACCGVEFDPEILSDALQIGLIPLQKRLSLLESEHRLVRARGRLYAFDENIVQESIYEDLPLPSRRKFHAGLAAGLAKRFDDAEADSARRGSSAVDLCQHYLRGGEPRRAGPYLDAALEHLMGGFLNAPAAELLERALAAPGIYTGAERVAALLERAHILDILGWTSDESATLSEALELAEGTGDRSLLARAERLLGSLHRRIAEFGRARDLLVRAASCAREAGDMSEEAAAAGELGLVAWREGRYEEARRELGRAQTLAARAGDFVARAEHRGNRGLVHRSLGEYEEAGRLHLEFLEFARAVGDRRNEALHTGYLAEIDWARGRYALAIEHHERALELSRAIGDRRTEGVGYLCCGLLYPELGLRKEGLENLEEARAVFRQTSFPLGEAAAMRGLGAVAEAEGRLEEAERLYRESLDARRRIGSRGGVAESLLDLGRIHGRMDRAGAAMQELVEAQSLGREMDWPHTIVLAVGYLALLSRGDVDYAGRVLSKEQHRLCHCARMEAHYILHRAAGDREHLERARGLLDELLEHAPERCRAPMREAVPLHREILAATGV